ncbi:MAG: aminotransferase class III-fold pyridoxal phosphate-dependent enzyme [Bdellovibrionales bacterium]|nr:aminotransferase class III-fold pyridoxal phosphate-dependent enzyme [Bdellovibrionales bacterium]
MDKYFVNNYKRRPLVVDSSEGSYLIDIEGNKYLDFISGISINNLGYGNKRILDAISKQLPKIIHPSNYYLTQPQINLAKKLVEVSRLSKVFFANSGTESNEASLQFLSLYSQRLFPEKNEIIVFEGTFLGRTFGSKIAGRGGNLDGLNIKVANFNDLRSFHRLTSQKTLAVHFELVLGHGGVKMFDPEVVQEIAEFCSQNNILIFVDEVQTGLGRTGSMFCYQKFHLQPDIVTLGKSLGGGLPLSAVIVSERLADVIEKGDYGCTMGGNSLACAAGCEVINLLQEPDFIKNISTRSELVKQKCLFLKDKYSIVKDIRCYGLMCGVEVSDQAAKEIVAKSFDKGLLVDIVNKNTVRLLPPLTISNEEVELAFSILSDVIKDVKYE